MSKTAGLSPSTERPVRQPRQLNVDAAIRMAQHDERAQPTFGDRGQVVQRRLKPIDPGDVACRPHRGSHGSNRRVGGRHHKTRPGLAQTPISTTAGIDQRPRG
jgi:hypothetical protein